MITLAIVAIFCLIMITNVGQLVHHTPNPNWFERIGR